jgi:hypothetical protein
MTPREYLETVVRPNMAEVNEDTGDIRLAHNAIASVDALGARLYHWASKHRPELVQSIEREDDGYREELGQLDGDYRLLCDVALAVKHIELRKKTPRLVYSVSEISPEPLMVDDMEDFDRDWTEEPCVLIQRENERPLIARNVLERALKFLEENMSAAGA